MTGKGTDSGSQTGAGRGAAAASEVRYPQFDAAGLKRSLFWATPTADSIRFGMRFVARLNVTGGEKVGHGPIIVAPFHASKIDPLVVSVAIWNQKVLPHFLAKSSLFGGFVGRALVTMGQIPVLRASTKAGDSLIHAKRALAAGQTVVIYPQGTLTKDPEFWPQPAKTGVSRLSIETGIPVIPVSHWGLNRIMPVGSKKLIPRPRHEVRVHFGEPLYPPALDAQHSSMSSLSRGFADRVTAGIAEGVADLRGVELPQRFRDTIDSWDTTYGSSSSSGSDSAAGSDGGSTGRTNARTSDDEETR